MRILRYLWLHMSLLGEVPLVCTSGVLARNDIILVLVGTPNLPGYLGQLARSSKSTQVFMFR